MRNSWNYSLYKKWRKYIDFASILKLRQCFLHGINDEEHVTFKFKSDMIRDIVIRGGDTDIATLCEIFDGEVYAGIFKYVKNCSYVIDLGANIGLASAFFAINCPNANICAVEPDTENFLILEKNLKLLAANGRAKNINAAVWGRKTNLILKNKGGHANSFEFGEVLPGESYVDAIDGLTIEDIIGFSGFETVDVLKIDIEGAEIELFSRDTSWLKNIRCVAIEFHGDSRKISDFDNLIVAAGFEIAEENDHTTIVLNKYMG
ncbi:FkbM family methyltransferase [Armatimonas rosea]|uniref:FkbM family methyltransferase n=1 Tax=Armatimonas rosea TaxID=685828 RepID=A0A7W9W5P8_ARMRO|nr:FkbM family methyltransferase [Armatimonas rosea]MBB6049276.1 FkbM family methyltransferase [Armatimonas rosea]